jgi:ribosomal protein S12 methylthiotransferase
MLEQGIREIQIISQDTTRYGTDIYDEPRLIEMLQAIDETITASGSDAKYRVYYLYPDILTLDHLSKLQNLKHFLPYFDIPFQHASENILKLMGRHYDRTHIDSFIEYIRDHFPTSFIRTSFIIGFPGETDMDFQILLDFVKKYQFESVGIFQYHDEPLAASSKLPNKIDDTIAKNRIKEITPILNAVYDSKFAERKTKKQTGYIMDIKENTVIVRPEMAAPEIDDYDEVPLSDITGNIEIGSKMNYTLRNESVPHRDETINRHD